MSNLPDWIDKKIDDNLQRDLRQRPVVAVIWESSEPYLSRTIIQQRVEKRVEDSFDKSTVIDRLTELVERNVLMTDEVCGGNIYWIFNKDSEWPIPSDVEVTPTSNEMTVQEFFNNRDVNIGLIGIGSLLLASIFMWVGGFFSASNETLYGLGATDFLTIGFGLILGGWFLLGASLILWFATKPTFKR